MDNLVSSPNSHKLHKGDASVKDEDLISELPDDLLLHILSFLSTREAIQTSSLAKRWKFLWTYLSHFNIDVFNPQRMNYRLNQVDKTLQKAKFIKSFCFVARGAPVDENVAHSLIFALLKHKIQVLELSFNLRSSFMLTDNFTVLKTLNKMHLNLGCVLIVHSNIQFPCLKFLTLQCMTFVDNTSAQNLLSGCSILEELTLFSCRWMDVENVTLTIPTVKTLFIGDFFDDDTVLYCQVTIDAVNLEFFTCLGNLTMEIIPVNFTSLARAFIGVSSFWPTMAQLAVSRLLTILSGISHVKSLLISRDTFEILYGAENLLSLFPTFRNLNLFFVYQAMNDDYGKELIAILEKSPKLEALYIGFNPDCCSDGEAWTLNFVPHCLKYSLKLVSIFCFCSKVLETQLLSFLVRNATILEKIEVCCGESLSADSQKQEDISNQLQVMRQGLTRCAIEFPKAEEFF